MSVFGWKEAQYSEWLDSHEEADALDLLERGLGVYVEDVSKRGEKEFCAEYPVIRSLIAGIRKASEDREMDEDGKV